MKIRELALEQEVTTLKLDLARSQGVYQDALRIYGEFFPDRPFGAELPYRRFALLLLKQQQEIERLRGIGAKP